jgi:hypothetical protein
MGTLENGPIDTSLLKSTLTPPQNYAAFYAHNLRNILEQPTCKVIRFYSAIDSEPEQPRETVIAVGYGDNGVNLTSLIRYDRLPCPPHCYNPGVSSEPNEDEEIDIARATKMLIGTRFCAKFSSDDLNTLLNMENVDKVRVFYGWTTEGGSTATFLLQSASEDGPANEARYGIDTQPESNPAM